MVTQAATPMPHVDLRRAATQGARALAGDTWLALGWIALLSSAAYASAKATPWLYPTVEQRVSTAEAINAHRGIVALYGPILDTHSLGELAMTKMTVLYAVLVATMGVTVVRRHVRRNQVAGTTDGMPLIAAMAEAAILAVVVGICASAATVAAGLPASGSAAFGASWAGIGLVAIALAGAAGQLPYLPRTCGRITAAALGLLFALRAVGDTTSAHWLSWLSPFGWSTQLEAWSTPRWWVLSLYLTTSFTMAAWAAHRNRTHPVATGLHVAYTQHRDRTAFLVWTVVTGGLAAYFGAISPDLDTLLGSAHARELIHRLGGSGPMRDVLVGSEFSIVAAVVTAFGITVFAHAAGTAHPGRFGSTVSRAFAGSTWLLLVTGGLFTVGRMATGGSATPTFVEAALNHAPAVWTVLAMTAIAWSWRPRWAAIGWGLLAVFVALGHVGRLLGLPDWVVGFSPFARIALMPAESFDATSTIALTASAGVLMAIAAFNHSHADIE